MKKVFICILVVFQGYFAAAQKLSIDSLKNLISSAKSDTERISQLNELSYILEDKNPDTSIVLAEQVILLCNNLLSSSGNNEKNIKFSKGCALVYKGGALFIKSDYSNSLKYLLEGLKIHDEINHGTGGDPKVENDIGNVYLRQNNYQAAIKYFLKSLGECEKAGDKNTLEITTGNLGLAYQYIGDLDNAIKYLLKSKMISEELKDDDGVSAALINIGNVYDSQGNIESALKCYKQALEIKKKIGDKEGITICYDNMGKDYFAKNKFNDAINNLQTALKDAREIGEKIIVQDIYKNFSVGYVKMKNYVLAYDYLNKYANVTDTIFNEQSAQQTAQAQAQYDTEKKQKEIELLQMDKEKQAAVAEAELRKKHVILFSSIAIILLLASFAFFMVNRFVFIRKQNVVIEEQKAMVDEKNMKLEEAKAIVDEKNKDIMDSINYAKRLQDAILPPLGIVKQYLPESFLLYKPKDIVAGDFYWMEKVGNNILIAAADCTGHGVPGALVSVVCSNALNRTVKEFKVIESGKILDKVRELVLETFEKSEDNVQDGMDISLCCINTKTNEVQWSGAYNSLWYIHNGEIKEVPADKQPIGKIDKPLPFSTHNLNLQKGDTLYLFTDGYADQFGGPKGKKFKYKQLQELLLANVDKLLEEQKMILESTLEGWKGELEQVDDILVIGIRV